MRFFISTRSDLYFQNHAIYDRQIFLNCIPDNIDVDTKIIMDQFISHPCHFFQGEFIVDFFEIIGNFLCGFTYDLKISNDCS